MTTKQQAIDAFCNTDLLYCLYRYQHNSDDWETTAEGREFEHFNADDWGLVGDELVETTDNGSELRRMMLKSNRFENLAVMVSYVYSQYSGVQQFWGMEEGEYSEETVVRVQFNGETTNFSSSFWSCVS